MHGALLYIHHVPETKSWIGDEKMYWEAAQRVAHGQPSELELLWPPFYPWFLALLLWLSGGSLLFVQLVQTALLGLCAWLVWDLCLRLHGSRRVAGGAAFLTLFHPPLVAFAHHVWPEILHLALFLAALWILAARRKRPAWLVSLGLVLGLALGTKLLLIGFVPVLFVPLWIGARARVGAMRSALVALGMAAALVPMMAANQARTGRFTLGNSGWFQLWVGLNDHSRKDQEGRIVVHEVRAWRASAEDVGERNAILRRRSLELVRERGILRVLADQLSRQYFRLLDKDSVLTDQLPGGFFAQRGRGYRDPPAWLAFGLRYGSEILYALVLVGAAMGLAFCPPAGRRWMWLVLAFLAYNAGIFLLLHVKSRYRVQLLPFLFAYALCGFECARGREGPLPGAGRWLAAGAGAALLLFLAFGGGLLG